ncbi:MAG TPA: SEC-C domain-containing protein [Niabella sp.]|jgi:hypothetical protein|nr:SEC-C domain-containing protein [Chitinophagaceae bacterium]HRN48157.1 SEC-C domain-containing protein [Niabella sp.]HRO85023.1 SEC-C domain-containing protein [Niabella sp.]HUN03666.1 SEC-C domain-containing protein [Niabella sp.]
MNKYKIVDNPEDTDTPWVLPEEIKEQYKDLYDRVIKGKPSVKKRLDKLWKRYPNVPMIWNFEAIWHEVNGNSEKSNEIVEQTLQKFPDYLYAITHKAILLMREEQFEEAYNLLGGGELDISVLYPERKAFHYSECRSYAQAAIEYLAGTYRFEEAEKYNDKLRDEKFEKDFITGNKNRIEYYRRKKFNEERKKLDEKKKIANTRETPTLPQIMEPLLPRNEAFEYLYEDSIWDLNENPVLNDIENNKEALIDELHYIMNHSLLVSEYAFDENETSDAVLNAALLLGYLDPEKGFDELLTHLRQPEEFIDFWFEDVLDEVVSAYFQKPSDELLLKVKNFVLEPLVSSHSKNMLIEFLGIMIEADAGYQQKVIDTLSALMQAFYDERENTDLLDTDVVASLVGAALDIKAAELMPQIEKMYKEELVSYFVTGSMEDARNSMQNEERRKFYFYKNLQEHIQYLGDFGDDSDVFDEEDSIYDEDYFDGYDDEDYEEDMVPVVPKDPYANTPRNAPCPCGSGKKYKRCHGKS